MAEPATDFIQVTVPTKNVNENGESQSKQLIYDRNRYSVKPERAYWGVILVGDFSYLRDKLTKVFWSVNFATI